MKENDKIDFVITWVNGNDAEWQKEKINGEGMLNCSFIYILCVYSEHIGLLSILGK